MPDIFVNRIVTKWLRLNAQPRTGEQSRQRIRLSSSWIGVVFGPRMMSSATAVLVSRSQGNEPPNNHSQHSEHHHAWVTAELAYSYVSPNMRANAIRALDNNLRAAISERAK